ncbi:MAG: hypothetical protein JSW71_04505 [Gemmatimonadota bacterium]|nr:MAG: hypothetical protein JSW71_04505 [Gemmatimonadota bacterium]
MTEVLELSPDEVRPERHDVFENQGIPLDAAVSPQIARLYSQAEIILADTAAPVGVLCEISRSDFAIVYRGEGRNEPNTPVGDIFELADRLALFTVTLGAETSAEIARRFDANDFALACMLDSAASVAADKTADLLERRYADSLRRGEWQRENGGVLRYSPGYCGWHISGQRKLFEFLRPEQIGVTLRDSFLMEPLKSVSGVIVAGPREIHNFPITYGFCKQCETRSCRQRLRALFAD